jgi:hypothetical protein
MFRHLSSWLMIDDFLSSALDVNIMLLVVMVRTFQDVILNLLGLAGEILRSTFQDPPSSMQVDRGRSVSTLLAEGCSI